MMAKKFTVKGESKLINDFVRRLVKGGRVKRVGNPYAPGGGLKPNKVYTSGKPNSPVRYAYQTDGLGRLKSAHARPLQIPPGNTRGPHNPNTPGKLPGDHAGHLIADMFGGSGGLDNLVSQASDINLSKMRKLENQWAKRIRAGEDINVDIRVIYDGTGRRPVGFNVYEIVDGVAKQVGEFVQ